MNCHMEFLTNTFRKVAVVSLYRISATAEMGDRLAKKWGSAMPIPVGESWIPI